MAPGIYAPLNEIRFNATLSRKRTVRREQMSMQSVYDVTEILSIVWFGC